jgi:mRNA interferase RelE/StbE
MLPYRIEWLDEAKGDVRRIDRATAFRVFDAILQFARTGAGDVTPLHGELAGAFRLRCGDYRVLFSLVEDCVRIFGVRHRSGAYR